MYFSVSNTAGVCQEGNSHLVFAPGAVLSVATVELVITMSMFVELVACQTCHATKLKLRSQPVAVIPKGAY